MRREREREKERREREKEKKKKTKKKEEKRRKKKVITVKIGKKTNKEGGNQNSTQRKRRECKNERLDGQRKCNTAAANEKLQNNNACDIALDKKLGEGACLRACV